MNKILLKLIILGISFPNGSIGNPLIEITQ